MLSYQRVISKALFCLGPVAMLAGSAGVATAQEYTIPPIVFAGVQSTIRTTGLSKPSGLAVDSKGNLYIADTGNDRVVEITAAGEQKTVVSGVVAGAALNAPTAVAVDTSFNIYVADPKNNRVLQVTSSGKSSLIGSGLSVPTGVAVDSSGNVYIADTGHGRIVEVSHGVQTIAVDSILIGSGSNTVKLSQPAGVSVVEWPGLGVILIISDSGRGVIAAYDLENHEYSESHGFSHPIAAVAAAPTYSYIDESDYFGYGFFYIVDSGAHRVWAEACPPCTVADFDYEDSGDDPGPQFSSSPAVGVFFPGGIATDSSGNIYISGSAANRVLKLTTGHSVNFGSVAAGKSGAPVPLTFSFTKRTKMTLPSLVTEGAVNADFKLANSGTCKIGATYNVDSNCTLDVIFSPTATGERDGALNFAGGSGGVTSVGTVYLHGVGKAPQIAYAPGVQTTLSTGFKDPRGVAVDGNGNAYVADYGDNEIYQVTPSGARRAFAALNAPGTLAIDGAGNLYAIANMLNPPPGLGEGPGIFEISPGGRESDLLTEIDDLPSPVGLAVDGSGDVFASNGISDVRETTFRIDYSPDYLGCYSPTYNACLFPPGAMAVDGSGNLYVVDLDDSSVWKVTPQGARSTVGSGFSQPAGLAVDSEGNLYVADFGNNRVVQVTPEGKQSTVSSDLSEPTAIAVDGQGTLYITDSGNGRLVKIDRSKAPGPKE